MKYKHPGKDMRLNKTIKDIIAPLMTAMIFLCVSSGKAETRSTEEAKKGLIDQCIRQMTESSADGTGKAMAFHMLQKLGPEAKSAVPALTKALDHEDSYIRIQSAYTLWKVDQQAARWSHRHLARSDLRPKQLFRSSERPRRIKRH
jgi:HEAT repeat protein